MHYVGAIDEPGQNRISGWAVSRFGDVCAVTAVVNGEQRFTVDSDGKRPDLAAKQQSRGAGGFRIDIASALVPGPNNIDILFPDGQHITGSPIARVMPADWVPPTAPRVPPVLKLAPAVPRLSPAELEDISLDDVCHAVAHRIIAVTAPVRASEPPPRITAVPPAAELATPALGWLGRLLRRLQPARLAR